MRKLLFILLIYSVGAIAQTIPSNQLVYFNEEFNTCPKEEAFYIGIKIEKEEGTDLIVYHPNGQQALTGSYLDKKLQKKNGMFTWFDTNGVRMALSEFKNNVQDGFYFFWYSNKTLRDSGNYKNGLPDGLWKSWYPNGQLSMICVYNARALADYNNASRYNKPVTERVLPEKTPVNPYRSGTSLIQNYLPRSRRNFLYIPQENAAQPFTSPVTDASLAKNNLRNNNQPNNRPENQSHIVFRYDLIIPSAVLLEGDYYTFYPGGQAKEQGSYKDGFKKGYWETWYENGKRQAVGRYEKNHEVQEWKYYNSDGELLMVRQYKKDGRLSNEIRMK